MQTILVVEDSALLLQMLSTVLKTKGFEVITANSGYEALKILDGRHIDMVLTDLIMPGIDGLDLTREIRGRVPYRAVPVLILTTQSSEKLKNEGTAAGVSGWVVKPFAWENLVALIQKHLGVPSDATPADSGALRKSG